MLQNITNDALVYNAAMWQDLVISAVQWVFVAALIPTIMHPTKKPTFSTSFTNVMGIIVVALVYLSLDLWISALGAVFLGLGWLTLAVQRFRLDRAATNSDSIAGSS